jgi:DNA-binding CsgD family transcriptional regulator/tetratricopeptide (TPR) repeat protein
VRDTLPLVGREAELALLTAALDRARRGSGSTHMITGEGGVGKTRLTVAAQAIARTNGFETVIGRAFPVETGIPYALFADAFVPLLRDMPAPTLQALSRGSTHELELLFPVLATGRAPGSAGQGAPAAELKARLLDAFSQLLQRLARRSPLLVVLENLQWADPSSFDLLHFVARSAGAHPLVLLCTYNESQREANRMLRTTEQSLQSLGALERHLLPPLTAPQVEELLCRQHEVPAVVVADFARALHARTRGNPFFIEETLKALTQAGRLRWDGERWSGWDAEHLDLPRSIRDALSARYDRLSPTAQDVVILASVVGSQVPHALLEVMSGVNGEPLLGAVDELLREQVLVEGQSGGHLAYEFTHPMMQEVLYAELSRARARQLHGEIAAKLESIYGDRASEHADALAVHFRRADDPAQADRACSYLAGAGRSALARGANREAAESLRAALAIAERGDDATLRDDLLDHLARALNRLGDYAAAAALWTEALSRAKVLGDDPRVATLERRLGGTALRRGSPEDALRHHDRGLEAALAGGDDALAASLRLARSTVLLEIGRGDDAERDLRAALATAEAAREPRMLARVHQALQALAVWRGPSNDARAHGLLALEYATAAGDPAGQWSAHWATAMHAGLTGDAPGTARHLAEANRLATELRSPVLRLWNADIEIEYRSGVGEWDAALALAERSIADARAFGQRTLLPRLLVWSALVHLGRGDEERGKAMVDEAWQLSGADRANTGAPVNLHTVVPAHVGLASWHLHRREYSEALRVGEAGLAIADRTGYTAWSMHRLMPLVAEASLWLRDWDRAERYGTRLRATAERLGHPLGRAWSEACFALIRFLRGDKAGAIVQLRQAADALDAIPFAEHGARLRRKLADAHNDSGDPDAAIPELRRVHETFARLRARPALEEVRAKLRELGSRPPVRTPMTGAGPGALTSREAEIARLVAARRSNKEIGAALGISARTVSTHLSNIFGKVGVDSRAALADRVREDGLLAPLGDAARSAPRQPDLA